MAKVKCGYCGRWFGRHRPWCWEVNPLGWIARNGLKIKGWNG